MNGDASNGNGNGRAYGFWRITASGAAQLLLLIGAMIGGVYAEMQQLFSSWLPPLVVAVLIVVAEALLTGALHMDALADAAGLAEAAALAATLGEAGAAEVPQPIRLSTEAAEATPPVM